MVDSVDQLPQSIADELRQDLLNLKKDGQSDEVLRSYAQEFVAGFDENAATNLDIAGQFAQGAVLNFGDEIYGAARSIFSDKTRIQETAGVRGAMARTRFERPVASTAAQIGGGVATALVPGVGVARGVAAGGGLLRAAGAAAASGAAQGAIAGGGAGSGSLARRSDGAATGALVGAGVGALAAPAARVAAGTGRAIRSAFTREGGEAAADAALRRTLSETGQSADDVATAMRQAQAAGVPITAGEAMGRQGVAALDDIANTANAQQAAVREAFEARQLAQPGRLRGNLIRETGSDLNAVQAAREVVEARSVAAGPRYEALNGSTLPPELQSRFAQVVGTPAGRRAYQTARSNSTLDNIRDPSIPVLPSLDEIAEGAPLSVRQADYVIRGIGDEGVRAGREGLNAANFSRNRLAQDLQEAVDDFEPLYREARAAWAGPSAFKDAVEQGNRYLSQDIDTFVDGYRRASQSERDGIRLGLLSAVKSKIEKGGTPARLDKGLDLDEKLRAVLDPQEYAQVRRMIDLETQASRNAQTITGNSSTARRSSAQEATENEALGAITAATDPQLGTIAGALSGLRARLAANQREALAPALLQTNPDDALMRLNQAMSRAPRFEGMRAPSIGGATGGAVGSAYVEREY